MTEAEKQERIQQIKARIAELEAEEKAQIEAQQEPGTAMKALQHGIELLDYPGGIVRTSLGKGADTLAEGARKLGMDLPNYQNYVQEGEVAETFNPFDRKLAPSGDVQLQRAGFGTGGSLSDVLPGLYNKTGEGWRLQKSGWADPTARGTAGFGLEVATDPLTYATLGIAPAVKSVGKLAKTFNLAGKAVDTAINKPATTALKELGKKMYKSAWKKVDEATGYLGKTDEFAPSEVAYRYNILGSQKKMQQKISEVIPQLKQQYDNILKNAEYNGGEININAAMKEADDLVNSVLKAEKPDPQLVRVAKEMKNDILEYQQMAKKDPSRVIMEVESSVLDASGKPYKTTVVKEVPGQRGVRPTEAQGFKQSLGRKTKWDTDAQLAFNEKVAKAMARGLRKELKNAANVVERGDDLERIGRELGSLLSSRKALRGEVGKETTKNMFSTIDAMSLWADPTLFTAKKAADLAKFGSVRTGLGYPVRKAGEKGDPVLDILFRRGAAQQMYTPATDRQGMSTADTTRPRTRNRGGMSTSAWQRIALDKDDQRR